MCGIVGYVGEKQAQDVVIEGLRRLEYRGYDSAGIALVADGRHRLGQAGRQAGQPREGDRRQPAAGVHDRHRAHPLGHPRRAERRQRPPAPAARSGRVALVHNGIIENFAELRAELEAAGHELLSETDTEVAAHLLELRARRRRRPDHRDAARLPRLEGAFTLVAVDAAGPVAGGRRPPQLAAGRRARRGRELPRLRRRRVHRAHPRGAGARPGPGRHDHPRRASRSPDFDGTPAEGRRYHVDWDLSAAEKDGHDWFMRKEIYEQPRAVADSLLGRRTPEGHAAPRRDAALRPGAARRRQDHHHRLRHVVLRRHGREVRHRALDAGPGRGRAGLGVPLPRPDPRPLDAGRRDQPVRRDRRHPAGDPARAHAALEGARDLQHQRLDDPARVRRGDLHPRRAGDRRRVDQGLPDPAGRLLPARALPRPGQGHPVRRRDRPRCMRPARGDARPHPAGARRRRGGLRPGPRRTSTPGRCSSSAGTPATRSRSRVR